MQLVRFRSVVIPVSIVGIACGAILIGYLNSKASATSHTALESPYWDHISHVDLTNLSASGKNAYFNLEPGLRLRYANGETIRTMTVRRKTKVVDGVETRVVEEKEEQYGQPTKIVWRYYAIDKSTGALYCFGVHNQACYKGRLVNHRGWRSGAHGAMFTLVLPAVPKVGDVLPRNHSPNAPRRQEEVIDVAGKVVTPAGTFTNCVRMETKGSRESKTKVFAPGVGLVQDGPFVLVSTTQTVPRKTAEAHAD